MIFLGILPSWEEIFRGLMALLCQAIYPLIAFLYNLFINISKVNILSSDTIKPIYQRVTMILTIIMIFYVTFEFVKFIVQPDGISDKEKGVGKIVYKMIAVVVLIALVPDIFTGAMKLQGAIVDKNVIGKVILGTGGNVGDNFGTNFSSQIFSMFYNLNEEYADEECDDIPCGAVVGMNIKSLRENGHLKYLTAGLNAGGEVTITQDGQEHKMNVSYINFDGLFAVVVGVFIGYILILYCIDVGVRWAQLVYLQIIAPIPIIGFLSPKKDGIFQKWCKQCFTTYLDLFLRIAIIYFVLLISSILLDAYNGSSDIFKDLDGISGFMKTLVYIVLILGVLLFAQKAPKLLQELFPSTGAASGNFGLKAGERFQPAVNFLKGAGRVVGGTAGLAAGAVIGAGSGLAQGARRARALGKNGEKKGLGAGIWGATKGAVGGFIGGAARGVYNGSKKGNSFKNFATGIKNQTEANKRFGNKEENGYGLGAQISDKVRSGFGVKSRTEVLENKKSPIKRQDEALKYITDTESSIKKRALEKLEEGSANDAQTKAAADIWSRKKTRVKDLDDPMSEARKEYQVGSVKDDAASKAAYQQELAAKKERIRTIDESQIAAGIQDDSLGVDKENFKMTIKEPQYDEAAHEKAKSQFMKTTGENEDGSPILEFDKASWEAAKSQFVTTKESEIFDNQSYQKALQEARSRRVAEIKQAEVERIESEFAQNVQGYVYQSSEEAEMALAAAKNKAAEELDTAQKDVVAAYVAHEGDPAITQMVAELQAHIDGDSEGNGGYNSTASSDRKLNVDYQEIIQNFKGFSNKVKKDTVDGNYRSTINANAAEIINIDTEIDRIKRQTEGTQDKK